MLFGDFIDHSLKCFGMIHGQVGQHLPVDFDSGFAQSSHQARIRQSFQTCGSVDTLYPQCAEITFLVTTVAESIG